MITRNQAAELLDMLSVAGRQKGRTSAIVDRAAADAINAPVFIVAATVDEAKYIHDLKRRRGMDNSHVRVVPVGEHLYGARSIFVDHYTLEVALGESIRREDQLVDKLAEYERELKQNVQMHLRVLQAIHAAGDDAAHVARTMLEAYGEEVAS